MVDSGRCSYQTWMTSTHEWRSKIRSYSNWNQEIDWRSSLSQCWGPISQFFFGLTTLFGWLRLQSRFFGPGLCQWVLARQMCMPTDRKLRSRNASFSSGRFLMLRWWWGGVGWGGACATLMMGWGGVGHVNVRVNLLRFLMLRWWWGGVGWGMLTFVWTCGGSWCYGDDGVGWGGVGHVNVRVNLLRFLMLRWWWGRVGWGGAC